MRSVADVGPRGLLSVNQPFSSGDDPLEETDELLMTLEVIIGFLQAAKEDLHQLYMHHSSTAR